MPKDDIYGRKEYDFSYKEVEPRDAKRTIDEMLSQGWMFDSQENKETKVFIAFYRKKKLIF
jgi:hypothetical protein